MNEIDPNAATIERSEAFWRHKARALLLPSPLHQIDHAGEHERAEAVLAWLRLDSGDESKLHEQAAYDTRAVHVPSEAWDLHLDRALGTGDEVPLRALLHPLSGERARDATDTTSRLADLRRQYEAWIDAVLQSGSAPTDSRSYAALWYHVHDLAVASEHSWLGSIPGDLALLDHTWLAQRTMAAALVGARLGGSEACLLHVHCGPVQSFITAARRTSDLWVGSYLVSLLTYQAVRAIADLCGPDSIIYPHLATLPLARHDHPRAHGPRSNVERRKLQEWWLRASQPNRFVAVVDSRAAERIAKAAAQGVLTRWRKLAEAAKAEIPHELHDGLARFDEQIDEHLEIDVVVQRWPKDVTEIEAMLTEAHRGGGRDGHADAFSGEYYPHVFGLGRDTLAAARGVITHNACPGDSRKKCTQCGRREAMGPKNGREMGPNHREWKAWWDGLRDALDQDTGNKLKSETLDFRRGETLCGVCLTKRLARRDLAHEADLHWENVDDRVLLRFPSVASIASAPLRIHLLAQAAHPDVRHWLTLLLELHDVLRDRNHSEHSSSSLHDRNLPGNQLPGLGPLGRGQGVLNFDGTWLYARSYTHDTVLNDHDFTVSPQGLEDQLDDARRAFAEVGKRLAQAVGKPRGKLRATPYCAVVVIDVDDMGQRLEGRRIEPQHAPQPPTLRTILEYAGRPGGSEEPRPISSSLHAEVSRRQGKLAAETVRTIVEHDHLGRVVYAGGDDVLAFVPLHTLWHCLHDVEAAFKRHDALGSKATLSAGVAIFDWRSPLSVALHAALAAEGRAKHYKNCVVVDLQVRSGAPIEVRLPWQLLDDDGAVTGDLEDITTIVRTLGLARETAGGDEAREPPLLRPSAAERLRRELEVLTGADLVPAFRARVRTLVRAKTGEPAELWLDAMIPIERTSPNDRRYTDVLARRDGETGQVVNFLRLIRFLVRELGGIDPHTLYEKIRTRQKSEAP